MLCHDWEIHYAGDSKRTSMIAAREIANPAMARVLFPGGGGLEVRRDGARPNLPLDLHAGLRAWHGADHPASAQPLRHHEADRHQVQQDRQEEDDADEHGPRGGLVDDPARLRAASTMAVGRSSPASTTVSSTSPSSSSSTSPSFVVVVVVVVVIAAVAVTIAVVVAAVPRGRPKSSKLPIFVSTWKRTLSRSLVPKDTTS